MSISNCHSIEIISIINIFITTLLFTTTSITHVNAQNDYVLDLRFQSLQTLNEDSLRNKTTYINIDVSHNNLEFISPHLLEKLQNLKELRMDMNPNFRIRKVEAFLHSKSLNLLSCSGCGFNEILSKSFNGLPALKTLDLSSNSIKSISGDAFRENPGLTFVNLSDNSLISLQADTFKLNQELLVLDLSRNQNLSSTPGKTFIENEKLETLFLGGCNFEVIDDMTFKDLPNLKEIYLQNNLIHEIDPNAFQLNPLLVNISFENNQLEKFPLSIVTDNIKNLCLDQNNFKLTRGYVRLYYKLEKQGLLKDNLTTICENRNETLKFQWLATKYQFKVSQAGISNAFISTYLLAILVAEGLIVFFLIFYFMKMKKKIKLEDFSQTILNENRIYKIMKRD
uniref:CSON014750 protein n=1 Tax=Culicoides sonorensis TaxID=179676 RepID=A0A336KTB0_CULSO